MKDPLMERAFALLCAIADKGERCPTGADMGKLLGGYLSDRGVVVRLARAGKIRIEVYGRNWRVIEILTGPQTGKRTAPPPAGGVPYKIVARAA